MTTIEIEEQIQKLPPEELSRFADWFEHFIADRWDKKIEEDIRAGRLNHLAKEADKDFEGGRCTPL